MLSLTSSYLPLLALSFALLTPSPVAASSYSLIKSYAGSTFFSTSDWSYYGAYDNLTLGDVIWVNETVATSSSVPLTYVNDAGNAIIRVDNTCEFSSQGERRPVENVYPTVCLCSHGRLQLQTQQRPHL